MDDAPGSALTREVTVPTERVYVLVGSQQGNAHVHWHVVALPPGVPYEHQQFRAVMAEERGVLALWEQERRRLAESLRAALGQ
jgi:diadenosine tetraphosphate (Ap4A) HIT family hydrolase